MNGRSPRQPPTNRYPFLKDNGFKTTTGKKTRRPKPVMETTSSDTDASCTTSVYPTFDSFQRRYGDATARTETAAGAGEQQPPGKEDHPFDSDTELASLPLDGSETGPSHGQAAPQTNDKTTTTLGHSLEVKELRKVARQFRQRTADRSVLDTLVKERKNVISKMTVASHHVKATFELMQEKLTPKWLQLGIQYDPMLRNDTDILDACKRIQNRFQTDIQLAMLNHHEQLVQQLGEKLTGLDEELVDLLEKNGGNAKQFTDIADFEEAFRLKLEGDFARRRNGKIRFLRNPSGPPGKRPWKEGNDTIVIDDDYCSERFFLYFTQAQRQQTKQRQKIDQTVHQETK